MKKDLVVEARELCSRATPGPWMGLRAVYEDCLLVECEGDEYLLSKHDVALIARSRTLIPELVEALEKSQKEVELITKMYAKTCEDKCSLEEQLAQMISYIASHIEVQKQGF